MNKETCKMCPLGKHEKILVAIDVSEYTEMVANQALNLAGYCRSTLFALTVIEISPESMAMAGSLPFVEKMDKEARTTLDKIKAEAEKRNVDCETFVRHGLQPHRYIVEMAEEKEVDAIVIGTHGRTGLKKLLMGSVAARVIGYTPCSVLVVPLKGTISLKNILVATDGSKYSEAAVKEAINIAKACPSVFTVICVVKPGRPHEYREEAEKIVNQVKQEASQAGIEGEAIVRIGEPHEVIVEIAKEKNVGTIVMGRHGRTGLKKLLMGSVTERVIGFSPCGVLVVP
ncbi:MAG: universal stress protein [Candidatus Desulfofervidus auxilii]|nr:universal stress protein [Candidatus Desulfofervidus auxilii]